MAKVQTSMDRPAADYGVGNGVFEQAEQRAAEMLNYAAGYSLPHTHVCVRSGPSGWGASGQEVDAHEVSFPGSSGYVVYYRFMIWVDADVQSILVGALATFAAANTGRVRFTIGGTSTVLNYTSATTTEQTATVTTAAAGTGWLSCTLELDHQTGNDDCTLDRWRVRNVPITTAANLPDPANE